MPTFMLSNPFYMALQTDIKCPVLILLLSPEIAVTFCLIPVPCIRRSNQDCQRWISSIEHILEWSACIKKREP